METEVTRGLQLLWFLQHSGGRSRVVPLTLRVLRLPVPQVATHRLKVLLRLEPDLLMYTVALDEYTMRLQSYSAILYRR